MIRIIREYTGLLGAILIMVGFCYSRVFMSIGTVLVFLQPILDGNLKANGQKLIRNKWVWLFWGYFLLQLLTFFYTENTDGFIKNIRILLPFALMPLGLSSHVFYSKRYQFLILGVFLLSICSAGLFSFIHYLWNYAIIHKKVIHSQAVPIVTGINHIYYSVLLAFGTLLGGIVFLKGLIPNRKANIVLGIITVANFVFLHVFSARTGLGGFYLSLGVLLVFSLLKAGKWLKAIGGVGLLGLAGVLAIILVPTLNNKYQNTIKDFEVYFSDQDPNHYSITMRLEAWEKTSYLIQQNPLIGVGPGDLRNELDSAYQELGTRLIPKNQKSPHNQFLQNFAGMGIPGILITLAFFIIPLTYWHKDIDWGLLAFILVFLFGFLFESILERQTGVLSFTFFALWLLNKGKLDGSTSLYP